MSAMRWSRSPPAPGTRGLGVPVHAVPREADAAQHGVERVVQLVGHAGGQLADHGQLLLDPEPLLQVLVRLEGLLVLQGLPDGRRDLFRPAGLGEHVEGAHPDQVHGAIDRPVAGGTTGTAEGHSSLRARISARPDIGDMARSVTTTWGGSAPETSSAARPPDTGVTRCPARSSASLRKARTSGSSSTTRTKTAGPDPVRTRGRRLAQGLDVQAVHGVPGGNLDRDPSTAWTSGLERPIPPVRVAGDRRRRRSGGGRGQARPCSGPLPWPGRGPCPPPQAGRGRPGRRWATGRARRRR